MLSYLVLRGRCRTCGARISPRYPLVELANGPGTGRVAVRLRADAGGGVAMALVTALLVLSLIDLDHQILPDVITLPAIVAGIAASFAIHRAGPGNGAGEPGLIGGAFWWEAPAAAAAGYAAFALIAWAGRKYYGQEALGHGDWKLAAMLGAFLGCKGLLLTVFLGSLLGAVIGLALVALRKASRTTRCRSGPSSASPASPWCWPARRLARGTRCGTGSSLRLPPARSLLVIALLLAGLVNVHALVLSVRAHARFRESAFATVRARVTGVRSALGQRIALGGGYDRDAALRQALAEGVWDAIEAFAPDGRHLAALPGPARSSHWSRRGAGALRAGAVLVGAEPVRRSERDPRLRAPGRSDEQAVVLRFTTASPELAAETRRAPADLPRPRRHPPRAPPGRPASCIAPRDGARRRGAAARARSPTRRRWSACATTARSRPVRHEAERRQMEEVLRDKEAMARAGELTAGIVHEVRNGLGTIVGYARLIEKTAPEARGQRARHPRGVRDAGGGDPALHGLRPARDAGPRRRWTSPRLLQRVVARESRRAGPAGGRRRRGGRRRSRRTRRCSSARSRTSCATPGRRRARAGRSG